MIAAALTGADLLFDAATHIYRLQDGRPVPSVTTILRSTGISTDFDALIAMSDKRRQDIEYARALGVSVHADCHALDDDDLVWESVEPAVLPYVEAWSVFIENACLFSQSRERRLYHDGLGVCGTLDGIFYRATDRDHRILIDIKTGDPESAGARYQTALYQILWEHEHPDQPITERWSVQLTPEHGIPYRITPYLDWTDGQTARAIVATYFAQNARRRSR